MSVMSQLAADIENLIEDGCTDSEIALQLGLSTEIVEQYREEFLNSDVDYDDSMDGDAGSALASAGWGTDEDYASYSEE